MSEARVLPDVYPETYMVDGPNGYYPSYFPPIDFTNARATASSLILRGWIAINNGFGEKNHKPYTMVEFLFDTNSFLPWQTSKRQAIRSEVRIHKEYKSMEATFRRKFGASYLSGIM